MVFSITSIVAIANGARKHRLWLCGLGTVFLLYGVSVSLILNPLGDYIRCYSEIIPYIELVLLAGYLLISVYAAYKLRTNRRLPKTPIIVVVIAVVLRVLRYICAVQNHSLFAEADFDWSMFHKYAQINHYLTGLTLAACYIVLLYYLVQVMKRKTGDGSVS